MDAGMGRLMAVGFRAGNQVVLGAAVRTLCLTGVDDV